MWARDRHGGRNINKELVPLAFIVALLSMLLFNSQLIATVSGSTTHQVYSGDSIQEAINSAMSGDTIFVHSGTYYEHVIVNKSLSLIGDGSSTTIIDGNMTGNVVRITEDHVDIRGFTIQRSGWDLFNSGISIAPNTENCDISGNRIVNNQFGVHGSPRNTSISNNTVADNDMGVAIDPGATRNIISRNLLVANTVSVHVYYADSNNISNNNMMNNWRSITIGYSKNNRFYHNNFFNNTEQILVFPSTYANFWDNGLEGNYWDNYTRFDSNYDGIGDDQYEVDPYNIDYYPLIGPFNSYNTSLGKWMNVISNSTVESFEYFEFNGTIRTRVSNMTVNQTFGFSRVTIPHELMDVNNITVIIDGGLVEPLHFNDTIYDNGTHRWIYFAYEHSTHEVVIIPEFPTFLILPLFMIATLLAVIIYKRKYTP